MALTVLDAKVLRKIARFTGSAFDYLSLAATCAHVRQCLRPVRAYRGYMTLLSVSAEGTAPKPCWFVSLWVAGHALTSTHATKATYREMCALKMQTKLLA